MGFFIIYRFVVRVLRLRGRANRVRLARRRRWGSRNLLASSSRWSVLPNPALIRFFLRCSFAC